MRRMYSKEQLQKLIDEVSRLIAIEELDKVVPVPALADAGKVIQVNATGTGYQLQNVGDLANCNIENIYDSDNNKRFVGGNISLESITGINGVYCKWSLSGTHLMIVICFSIAEDTVFSALTTLAYITLPSWIMAKIQPIYAQIVDKKTFKLFASNGESQELEFALRKENTNFSIFPTSSLTASTDKTSRLEFDLLIDND